MPLGCSSFEVSFSLKLPWPLGTKLPWNLVHPLPWSVVSICPWLWVYIYGNACPVLRSSPCWKPCTQCGVAIVSSPKPWFKVARAWLKSLIRLLSQSLEKGFVPPWRWGDGIISRHVPYGEESVKEQSRGDDWSRIPQFPEPHLPLLLPKRWQVHSLKDYMQQTQKKMPLIFWLGHFLIVLLSLSIKGALQWLLAYKI